MHKIKLKIIKGSFIKRFLSIYIITILVGSGFATISIADDPITGDNIFTYVADIGGLNPRNHFNDKEEVVVNITVDNITGDPQVGMYHIIAENTNTTEWIQVFVTDNDTNGPWGLENQVNDGSYWGMFSVNSSRITENATNPGDIPNLEIEIGHEIDIYEDPTGLLDGDPHIAFNTIEIVPFSGPGNENGSICGLVKNETQTPIHNAYVTINRTDGPFFQSTVLTDPSGYYLFDQNISAQGTYDITAYKPQEYPNETEYDIQIFPDQLNWVNITFGGPGNENGSICGLVKNETQTPIHNAYVTINRTDGPFFQSTVLTDPSGYYLFDQNISAQGTYDITAYKPQEYPNETEYDIHLNPNELLWINISYGSPSGGNGTLCGFITYQDTGSGNQNVEIYVSKTSGPFFEATIFTNETGFYIFNQNLTTGTYNIEYSKPAEFDTFYLNDYTINANYTHWENHSITVNGGGGGGGHVDNITISGQVYQDFTPEIPISYANITVITSGNPSDVLGQTTTDWEGFYELTFLPNETAVNNMNNQIEILFEADGYETETRTEDIWWMLNDEGGMIEYEDTWLQKIWEINATITGTIRDVSTNNPLDEAFVMVEGEQFFMNFTQTNSQGDFSIGAIAGELEMMFELNGYFANGTDAVLIPEGVTNLGTIYLEQKPPYTATIRGNLTCEGQPLIDTEMIIYDPLHPFDGEEKQFPRTDENGYFEIQTYPGTFYLITLAQLIGKSRHGPPLAIGGYENVVDQIIIGENQTINHNISINSTNPDPITISISFDTWNLSTVNMTRQIISNNNIIRLMSDIDFDGTISEEEAADMEDIVNSSLTQPDGFDMEALFLNIPLQFGVDNVIFSPIETNVKIQNLRGSTTATSSLTVLINATYEAIDYINLEAPLGPSLHSVEVKAYLKNPAFSSTITTTFPSSYLLKNAKEELTTITGYGTNQAIITPNQDPNWNDSESYVSVPMLVGTSEPFASFNTSYFVETPFDDDSDGDYDYLMGKVKFTTSQAADYHFRGTLRSQTGIRIGTSNQDKYANIGTSPIQLSFDGEQIYRKHLNGPYTMIFDIYVYDNDSLIWLDSIMKTTSTYNTSEFDKPPLHFIQITDDTGQDTDNDGLYDYLIISLELDVGQIDSYEFDADIGIADHSYNGDPHIAHLHKTISLHQTGIQIVNFTFDGSMINQKQTNASLWAYIQARSFTEGHLDDIDYITNTYHFDEFASPPPENCTIQGTICNVFGQPIEAQIQLFDQRTFSQNSTTSDGLTGNFSLKCRPGIYSMDIWPTQPGVNLDSHWEVIMIGQTDINETLNRTIKLLPYWHECGWLDWMIETWQFSPGDPLHVNLSTFELPDSNYTIDIYKEIRDNDFYYGEQFLESYNGTTNESGEAYIVINTNNFTNGQYMIRMYVANQSQTFPQVVRSDAWGLQVSSLELMFDLDKQKYKPGGIATGMYTLSYISNDTEVIGGTYSWKIMYWDWMGEHVLDSGVFTNDISGNGTFTFEIPPTITTYGDWFDLRFTATDPAQNEVFNWRGFGITTGSTIESADDYPIGQQGNYDGLAVNVTVNVTQSGNYRINGGLNDQNWHWITGNETQQYLNTGETNITILFEGEDIQREGRNGPYRIWIGLYHQDQWDELDNLEYITTTAYNYGEFARPDVGFDTLTSLTYYTIGPQDNYDMLVVNASINASIPGNYSVHSNLHKRVQHPDGWDEWFFVAWNQSEVITIDGGSLNTTIPVPIFFEGTEIYNNAQNGPYRVNFNLHKVHDQHWHEWIGGYDPDDTLPYNYNQFAKPSAYIASITDQGNDTNDDLWIQVTVNVSDGESGQYHVNGNLHSSHETGHIWITHSWNETFLDNGTNTIDLIFSGDSIYSMGYDGPYILHLDLEETNPWNWLGHREFTTSMHNYTDFSLPDALFTGNHSDNGFDEDGDGDYDGIRIEVPIIFDNTGWYEVSGELYQDSQYGWHWIAWSSNHTEITSTGEQNITLEYSGYDILNSGFEGQFSVNLWLRNNMSDIGHLSFDTHNSYMLNQFGQPAVQFTPESPLMDDLTNGGKNLNISLAVNSTELGSYYVNGHMHKVIHRNGWDEWFWISYAETPITITQTGITNVTVSFDTAQIQMSGYDGPYTLDFDLMDENWMHVDHIHSYQTQPYMLTSFSDRPAYFNETTNDYLSSTNAPEFLNVEISLFVNESGNYNIGGDLHKNQQGNWNFIAGSGKDQYFATGNHIVTLQFDTIEIKDNLDNLGLTEFDSGSTFDVDVWLRRQNEWHELDQKSFQTNTYYTSNFSSTSAAIEQITDNGYNESDDAKYEYLNITAQLNITESGEYEIWCDLHKQDDNDWQWLGWTNEFITVTTPTIQNVTLQFNGEQISASEQDGPYQIYMELMNFDTRKRMDRYDGETNSYSYSEFVGSSVTFDSNTASATGYDSDDPGSEYDYLRISVNVTAAANTNIEFRGDLHKDSQQSGWQWIGWANNWTSINTGTTTLLLDFDGEAIRNSEIDGPYQLRLELWDTDNWKLLDTIEHLQTDSYTYDNFQASSAQFMVDEITDWGIPIGAQYAYLEINTSVNVSSAGYYEIMGDLHSDTNGWHWLGWTNNHTYLDTGEQIVKLQFDGMRIRNEEVNGPYKVRLELQNENWRTIDTVEPYETNPYNYNDFQSAGAEITTVSDQIISNGDFLELNATINCTTTGTYWLGADLHKQSGWDWQWIAWESTEEPFSVGQNNITILFSGESIYNSEIDGPYHIRLELRDTDSWSEQDFMERYTTDDYNYTDFAQPSVSFGKENDGSYNITDWGNDTDTDTLYNYLQFNITVNSSQSGNYWLHSDLHKQSGHNWQWLTGKGQEIQLDGTGEQQIVVQFDGERISDSGQDSPYKARFEISNINTWTRLAVIDEYSTQNTYLAEDFQRTSIEFVENDTTPSDWGIGTPGAYSGIEINVTINSSVAGEYWLHADLHKETNHMWQWIDWNGTEIQHSGTGEELFTIRFNGASIRNKGINGPYQVRLELNSMSGEWKQYDVIEGYNTQAYSASDFQSAGIELADLNNTEEDAITNGNLRVNVSVNASTTGVYEIGGDLHKESGWNWQWISWNTTEFEINTTGQHTIPLIFEGGDIFDSGIDGPYHIRIELRDVGSWSLIDTIDRYTTNTYQHTSFSAPTSGFNNSETSDSATSDNILLNITAYSETNTNYQFSGSLHGENWEFICWDENITTIQGYDNEITLAFDGSIINANNIDPTRAYIEMRRTSDWKLIDFFDYDLTGLYTAGDFGSSISIDANSIISDVWDEDNDGYNDTLNVSVNITFDPGNYGLTAGLRDTTTDTFIQKQYIDTTAYSGVNTITFSFDGLKIYKKGLDGPYNISFISITEENIGEIARVTNAHTTAAYQYTSFDHPLATEENANLAGIYSSYAVNISDDERYEYLIINVSVDILTNGSYDIYGDLYSDDGTTWVAGDANNSNTLTTGQNIIQLHFEGNDIYESQTDGPYLLGFILVGADIDESWIILDDDSNVYTTSTYDYTDFTSYTQAPLLPSNISEITVSNDPFSPNNDGSYETTQITVTGNAGQTLYLNIYDNNNSIIRTGMQLSASQTTYTATWQGKNDLDETVEDGIYRIKVTDNQSDNPQDEAAETTTVVVDTQPPTGCSFTIENADTYTNSTSVDITSITATDNSSIKMRFKNAAGNWTSWENFQSSKSWVLTSTDGIKTVYYEAKDVAGNTITSPKTESITLDTTKPSNVNITITGKGDTPSTHTNDVSVTLSIQATDATSVIEYMMIANDMAFTDRSWEAYDTSKEWTLNSAEGTKTVYIKVKDSVGKESNIYSDSIILDTTAPTGLSITINSDQTYTNTTNTTLTLAATGAAKMRFSNDGSTWSNYESYATERNSWTLTSTSGTKTVYFQVKDTAGNIATNVTDTIILDTTAPTISSVTSSGIAQTTATITWITNEASTTQIIYGTTTNYGSNTTINTTKITSHSQTITGLTPGTTYHYIVKSRDSAGNIRSSSDETFTTSSGSDTTPPAAIQGLSAEEKTNAEKTITLTWNQTSASDFAAYKIYRKTAIFTNVSASGVQLITTITAKTTTTYDDTTATDGTTYYYAVTAIDTATPPNELLSVTTVTGTSVDDKAPTTSDNIPVGWQASPVTVTLSATDNGKGVNKTYYTTDGSNPTNSSNNNRTQYTAPFTIGGENELSDGTWTIKYYSYDRNTTPNIEGIHTKTLKVDTEPPSTYDNAPTGWQNTTVTITLTATDATSGIKKTYYTKDGTTPTISSTQYSNPILITQEGNRTLKYFSRDNATNDEEINSVTIQIDTIAPTSSITALSTYSNTPLNVSWTSSDSTSGIASVTLQVKNGSGSWTTWLTGQNTSGTQIFTEAANGNTYAFRSIATDNAGNIETDYSDQGDTSTTIAAGVPTASITNPTQSSYHNGLLTITGTAEDSGGNINGYWLNYSTDQQNWTAIATSTNEVSDGSLGTLNTSALTDGTYYLSLAVTSQAGLRNWQNISFTIDNTAPILSTISVGSISTNRATITWTTGEATNATIDYGTTTSYTINTTQTSFTTSHSITLTSLSSSTTYHYQITVYDQAGNSNTTTDATFTTSTPSSGGGGGGGGGGLPPTETPPTTDDEFPDITNIYHEPTTITYQDYISIYATITDDNAIATVQLTWNDGTEHSKTMNLLNNNIYFTEIGPFSDGLQITYNIKATDNASHTTTSESNSFTITDTKGPTITIIKPIPSNTIYDTTPTFKIKYTDPNQINLSSIKLTLNDIDITSWSTRTTASLTYTPNTQLTMGSHQATIIVADTLGNIETKTWKFTIEKADTITEETIGNVTAGQNIKITPDEDTSSGIAEIDILSKENLSDVKIMISSHKNKPEHTGELPDTNIVYSYLEIEATTEDEYIDQEKIESLTISFKIPQTWFENQNIEPSEIVLLRYTDDTWQELDTIQISKDQTYIYFQATTPGLSSFAITAKTTGQQMTGAEPPTTYLALIIAIIAIAVLLGIFYKKRVI